MTATATEPWTTARHPLARLLRGVAAGAPPEADGGWARVSPWIPTIQAVVAFTGHTIVAITYDLTDAQLTDMGVDGRGGAFTARTLTSLAGPSGWIGVPAVLHCGLGAQDGHATDLAPRSDLSRHPCVEEAKRTLQDTQVFSAGSPDDPDIVVLGRGVAGVREFAVCPARAGDPRTAELVTAALKCVPENEVVLTSVPAYDAAALVATRAGGMHPIAGVQLFSNRPEHRL